MKRLNGKCMAAVQQLDTRSRDIIREIFRGESDWGQEEDFLSLCADTESMNEDESVITLATLKESNQLMGAIICPDGRC